VANSFHRTSDLPLKVML